jgi:hypothetical protein
VLLHTHKPKQKKTALGFGSWFWVLCFWVVLLLPQPPQKNKQTHTTQKKQTPRVFRNLVNIQLISTNKKMIQLFFYPINLLNAIKRGCIILIYLLNSYPVNAYIDITNTIIINIK